jgi:hypothetical protein
MEVEKKFKKYARLGGSRQRSIEQGRDFSRPFEVHVGQGQLGKRE